MMMCSCVCSPGWRELLPGLPKAGTWIWFGGYDLIQKLASLDWPGNAIKMLESAPVNSDLPSTLIWRGMAILPEAMWRGVEGMCLEALCIFWRKFKMKYFHNGFILSVILKIILTVRGQSSLITGCLISAFSGLRIKSILAQCDTSGELFNYNGTWHKRCDYCPETVGDSIHFYSFPKLLLVALLTETLTVEWRLRVLQISHHS